MSDSKRRISTSPNWGVMILGGISIAILSYFYNDSLLHPEEYSGPMSLEKTIVYSLLCIYAIVRFSVHYTFTEKYLTVRFLGIPFRFIPWRSIRGAIYLHTWYENRQGQFRPRPSPGVVKGKAIFVSLGYCRQFDPEYDTRWRFQMASPLSTLFIRLPEKKAAEYIEVFRTFYPDLAIQPPGDYKE